MKKFDGHWYYDDRLFVLHLCMGAVDAGDELVTTTIFHENPPPNAIWCLVTYRNCETYPAVSVIHFQTKDDATEYVRLIEPTTPLISCSGHSAAPPLSYDAYVRWKMDLQLDDYDYRKCYNPGGSNPKEIIMQTTEQFVESQKRIMEPFSSPE